MRVKPVQTDAALNIMTVCVCVAYRGVVVDEDTIDATPSRLVDVVPSKNRQQQQQQPTTGLIGVE